VKRAWGNEERGIALVEFALIAPVLILLVFGVVDIGRAYRLENQLKNAARAGATVAQVSPLQFEHGANAGQDPCADPHNVLYQAQNELGSSSGYSVALQMLDGSGAVTGTITGCDNTAPIPPGTRLRVDVSSTFEVLTPVIGAIIGNSITVHGTQDVVAPG
jgi:hypothetical protein